MKFAIYNFLLFFFFYLNFFNISHSHQPYNDFKKIGDLALKILQISWRNLEHVIILVQGWTLLELAIIGPLSHLHIQNALPEGFKRINPDIYVQFNEIQYIPRIYSGLNVSALRLNTKDYCNHDLRVCWDWIILSMIF